MAARDNHIDPAVLSRGQGCLLGQVAGNSLGNLVEFRNPELEEGIVDTVMRGGDTDTNAAIAGALLGAVHGRSAISSRWMEKILTCRPGSRMEGVRRPRPTCYWPVDALELAEQLMAVGRP